MTKRDTGMQSTGQSTVTLGSPWRHETRTHAAINTRQSMAALDTGLQSTGTLATQQGNWTRHGDTRHGHAVNLATQQGLHNATGHGQKQSTENPGSRPSLYCVLFARVVTASRVFTPLLISQGDPRTATPLRLFVACVTAKPCTSLRGCSIHTYPLACRTSFSIVGSLGDAVLFDSISEPRLSCSL